MVVSGIKTDLRLLIRKNSLEKTFQSFLLLVFMVSLISLGGLTAEIAYCDGKNAFSPPPTPVQLPEEPVTPPPPPPVPQPVVIHHHPLLSDAARRSILYTRYTLLNLGGNDDFRRMVSIIDNQVVVERSVEAALVEDGFRQDSILARFRDIRGILHSPQGELFSERTYQLYVSQIRERGTRQSVPYRRIIRAIQNFSLLLER